MVLLDNVTEVFALPQLDVGIMSGVATVDGYSVSATLVYRDLLWLPLSIDRGLN